MDQVCHLLPPLAAVDHVLFRWTHLPRADDPRVAGPSPGRTLALRIEEQMRSPSGRTYDLNTTLVSNDTAANMHRCTSVGLPRT